MRWLLAAITLAYPFLVYAGVQYAEPRWVAALLAALAVARACSSRSPLWLSAAIGALLLAALSAYSNGWLPLKLYPVLVNGLLLLLFGWSLRYPPSAIERLARLTEPDLPPSGVRYTRRVTQVWCGFFLGNGSIALYTATYSSDHWWALYNGCIAYVLMGILFAAEWLVRQKVKAGTSHG